MYLSMEILQNIGVTDKMLGVKYSKFGVELWTLGQENTKGYVRDLLPF